MVRAILIIAILQVSTIAQSIIRFQPSGAQPLEVIFWGDVEGRLTTQLFHVSGSGDVFTPLVPTTTIQQDATGTPKVTPLSLAVPVWAITPNSTFRLRVWPESYPNFETAGFHRGESASFALNLQNGGEFTFSPFLTIVPEANTSVIFLFGLITLCFLNRRGN